MNDGSSFRTGHGPCACGLDSHTTRLVAVTGGPGAGKTAVLELALRSFCCHVGVLPESAGIVFGGGFPRRDAPFARRAAQATIMAVQRQLEKLALEENQVSVMLCDRGTIDGLAYWPGPESEFEAALGQSREKELARYAGVIHLRTPSPDHGYNHDNHLRTETAEEAWAVDERIFGAWATHPSRTVIDSGQDFAAKASRALEAIEGYLPACCAVAAKAKG